MADRHARSELADAPVEQIEAQLKRVHAERARLEQQEQQLTEILRARAQEAGQASTTEAVRTPDPGDAGREEHIAVNVLTVVRRAGGQSVAPADVQAQLASNGLQADLDSVCQALGGWVAQGALGEDDQRYFDVRPMSNPNFEYTDLPPRPTP